MKVAVVSPYDFAAFGGVQDQVARLVRWLSEAGHDAWAVAPGSGGPDGTRHVGVTVAVPANRSKAPITLSPAAVKRVAGALDGAEVVHVHEPFMPVTSIAAVMGAKVPVVATFHADPARFVRSLYRGGAPILRMLVRRMAAVTAVSPVAASAIGHLVDPVLVPNGLDVEDYARSGPAEQGRVVFIGRDEARKGLDVLLQAWPYITARVPGARLRVVGTDRSSGPSGVEFLGRVDEEAKRAELRAAAVMATPNLGGESFGIVVAEGMAAGCAMVASDLPAFRNTLGSAGRLVPPGDVMALAGAVADLAGDLEEATSWGARAATAAGQYGRGAVLGGYEAAYRRALATVPDGG
ncbi:glycosyltransferase family 4 protein [bacterium]|nr:glycosyltransferase family 4 protein [bacterium]